MSIPRLKRWLVWAGMLAGCAGSESRPRDATALNGANCRFVGIESVHGASDVDSDSVALLAVYRWSDPGAGPSRAPLSLKFVVSRSRVEELRDHLATQSEVLCRPDAGAGYAAEVEPFEGMPGIPHR